MRFACPTPVFSPPSILPSFEKNQFDNSVRILIFVKFENSNMIPNHFNVHHFFNLMFDKVVLTAQFGLFEYPLIMFCFIAFSLIFVSPVTPFCIVPDAKGSSDLSETRRKSRFTVLQIADAPVEGSKPMNFKFSPMWIEYQIASFVAPPLVAMGVTPNMVEEKFGKYFGYLARCEGKFCTTTLKN